MHISEAYIRLCSHLACCVSIDVQMIYTLSPTRSVKHTCSHLGCSVHTCSHLAYTSVKHTCSHLAYTSVKHTCSQLACCISIDVQTIYTLSPTRARDSVNSHVTHKHLLRRCKPGKYAVWKHRQLVVVEKKVSVGRREENSQAHSARHNCPVACASVRAHA
jgi:hypothetical protein